MALRSDYVVLTRNVFKRRFQASIDGPPELVGIAIDDPVRLVVDAGEPCHAGHPSGLRVIVTGLVDQPQRPESLAFLEDGDGLIDKAVARVRATPYRPAPEGNRPAGSHTTGSVVQRQRALRTAILVRRRGLEVGAARTAENDCGDGAAA